MEVGLGDDPVTGVACTEALRQTDAVYSCIRSKIRVWECAERRGAQEGRGGRHGEGSEMQGHGEEEAS